MSFAVGDVVMLKSSGPRMTINWVSQDGLTVECLFFQGCPGSWGALVSETCQASSLKKVEEKF